MMCLIFHRGWWWIYRNFPGLKPLVSYCPICNTFREW